MIYHVDGFVLDKNPSPRGGGFTMFDVTNNQLIVSHTILRPGFTNNDGELLAIAYAARRAQPGDEIVTDAQVMLWWCDAGRCKARPDLSPIAAKCKRWIESKRLKLVWQPRDMNMAGGYNESMVRQ